MRSHVLEATSSRAARVALPWLLAAGLLFVSPVTAVAHQKAPPKKAAPSQKEQKPGPLELLYRQAEEAIQKEDFAAAAKALEEYLSQRPEDAIVHFQLAYAYTGLNRPEDAQREYARAIELDPRFAQAHLNLGLLNLDRDPAAAIPPLTKAAELMPGEARPRFLLGLAYERAGNAKVAIESYAAARDLDGKNFDIRFSLGRVLLASGRTAEAESEFRAALGIQADSAAARLGLAEALLAQEKLEEAAQQFRAYLEKKPDDHETRLQLAGLYLDLGKDEPALAELERTEAAGHRSFRLFDLRAAALTRLKKFAEAAATVEKAIELKPSDAQLHARLGRLRLEQREFPAAAKSLTVALRLKPDFTEALRDLVSVYYLAENYPAALQALDLLAKRETLLPISWFVRATCYDKLAMKPEALAAYKTFVQLDQGRSERQDFQARQRIRILTRELERRKR